MSFVDANIVLDPSALVTDALNQLNTLLEAAGLPGWDSADADLLVIFLSTVAQIAADNASAASVVLPAIFRAYGTQLLGVPYQAGTKAQVYSTWMFSPAAPSGGYVIPAQTTVIIDGQAFYTAAETDVSAGSISATVLLQASGVGTAFNALGDVNAGYPDVQLNNSIDWVANVATTSQTSGGTDPETDAQYMDRLTAELQLQAPRPITASDFASFVTSDIAGNATGVAVGRATSLDGYYPMARSLSTGGTGPAPLTLTGSLTNASPTVSITTPPYPYAIPFPGASVTGTAIPTSTTVLASPAPTTSAFTMSGNATAAETGETITVSAWSNVERCVTTFVTDAQGQALTASEMDALQAWLDGYREESFLNFVEPPSYNSIYVSAEIHALPGYSSSSVCASVQTKLSDYLNPATWGNPPNAGNSTTWLSSSQGFNVVRYSALMGVIQGTVGVQYVLDGTLKLGFGASPSGTTDLAMTGPAPLPQTTTGQLVITADN